MLLELLPAEKARELWTKYNELWTAIVKPAGLAVFGLTVNVLPNGSGFHWINEYPFNR